MDKLNLSTPDFTSENIEKITSLFPEVATEAVDEIQTDDLAWLEKGNETTGLDHIL